MQFSGALQQQQVLPNPAGQRKSCALTDHTAYRYTDGKRTHHVVAGFMQNNPGNRHSVLAAAALKRSSSSTVGADYFRTDDRPVILFDGVCNLCNGAVNFLLDWDTKGQYRLAALQSKAGSELLRQAGRKPGDLSSVVLVEPGQAYVKSEAVLRIGRRLNTPFYLLGSIGLPVPSFIRDAAYDLVATTRYQVFGKTESCRMCDPSFRERFIDT